MVNLKGKVKFRGGKLNRAVLNKDSEPGAGVGWGAVGGSRFPINGSLIAMLS